MPTDPRIASYQRMMQATATPGGQQFWANQLAKLGGTTQVTVPTYTTQTQAPETRIAIQNLRALVNQLRTERPWEEASEAIQGMIGEAAKRYGTAATRGARTAQESALSTGFTPFEAVQAGDIARQETLRNYFTLLPQLRTQQAQYPIQYQEFLANTLAPLYELIARLTTPQQLPGATYSYQPSPIDYSSLLSGATTPMQGGGMGMGSGQGPKMLGTGMNPLWMRGTAYPNVGGGYLAPTTIPGLNQPQTSGEEELLRMVLDALSKSQTQAQPQQPMTGLDQSLVNQALTASWLWPS